MLKKVTSYDGETISVVKKTQLFSLPTLPLRQCHLHCVQLQPAVNNNFDLLRVLPALEADVMANIAEIVNNHQGDVALAPT